MLTALTEREAGLIARSLRAAAEGPFFPDWEFATLIGRSRDEVRQCADAWQTGGKPTKEEVLVAASVLNNLLGYPHGETGELVKRVGADASELTALFEKLDA